MGSVVVSVDAELAWGFHDMEAPPADRIAAGRPGWLALLSLFERYRVPATWAVVGHLFLSDCDGTHPEHPAPIGWFEHERGSDRTPDERRFGRDLVSAIGSADVAHDVGAHTFSHVELGDPRTTRELARAEVAASLEVAHRDGLDPVSFVFPRNNVGHRDVLAAYGFRCYRGVRPDGDDGPRLFGPARKLAGATVGDPPSPVTPSVDEYGLVNVPASLYLFGFEGLPRSIVEPVIGDPIVRQARRGIDAAARSEGVFHVWLHPNNLVDDRDVERVRSILAHVDRRRRETPLAVETMRDVADRVLEERVAGEVESVG